MDLRGGPTGSTDDSQSIWADALRALVAGWRVTVPEQNA
jgi:hypothetical protein